MPTSPIVMLRRLAALAAFLLFGSMGPAQAQRSYPSLAPRPIETRDRDAEIAQAALDQPPVKPLDAGVTTELDRLRTRAVAAGEAFDRDFAASDRAVQAARDAAPSTEAWVTAQEAVSALDARRFDAVLALAGMDSIYIDQLNLGGDAATVEGFRAPVAALVDGQNDRLDSLRGRLAQP